MVAARERDTRTELEPRRRVILDGQPA